jgi:hypothetical protein
MKLPGAQPVPVRNAGTVLAEAVSAALLKNNTLPGYDGDPAVVYKFTSLVGDEIVTTFVGLTAIARNICYLPYIWHI